LPSSLGRPQGTDGRRGATTSKVRRNQTIPGMDSDEYAGFASAAERRRRILSFHLPSSFARGVPHHEEIFEGMQVYGLSSIRPRPSAPDRSLPAVIVLLAIAGTTLDLHAWQEPYQPAIDEAPPRVELVSAQIGVPEGFGATLFAAEPLLANPVCFTVDDRGVAWIVETFRLHAGVTDTRQHMYWLDDDLALRSVEDRVDMYRRFHGVDLKAYTGHPDRVRRLEDRDGDRRADRQTIFADGFDGAEDGIGAGLLPLGDRVLFTCIPSLWELRDSDDDGRADVRRELQTGYGVHVGFLGHDLHGIILGPDERIWFSIGDRGLRVRTPNGLIDAPDTGSVLRCEPDGSGLEIYATGLRNPQEIVFDDFGNLFTCDNNSDSGDRARIVHVVEGGDSGWRIGYQFITEPRSRGPWNAEKLWHPAFEGQAAWIVPQLENFADGPSGLAIAPGTGWPSQYAGKFFLCDFRGDRSTSGILAFGLRPRGASFELVHSETFARGVLATDCEFGPDGALWVSDWIQGWGLPRRGRLHRITPPGLETNAGARLVEALLRRGLSEESESALIDFLSHDDRRIRARAQSALTARGTSSIPALTRRALSPQDSRSGLLARIHAIWALETLHRRHQSGLGALESLLRDSEPELRSQAARALGETRDASFLGSGIELLADESPRVRYFAAMALGKLGRPEARDGIHRLLEENADRDPHLRHAAIQALVGIRDPRALEAGIRHHHRSVRIGTLVALRRLKRPEVGRFLDDTDPRIVEEAARAIWDEPIPGALPALERTVFRDEISDVVQRRALAALELSRSRDSAALIAELAAQSFVPTEIRIEALDVLGDWPDPSGRDRITGLWRPVPRADVEIARAALEITASRILEERDERIISAAIEAIVRLDARSLAPNVRDVASDARASTRTRRRALAAIHRLDDPETARVAAELLESDDPGMRSEALEVLVERDPTRAVEAVGRGVESRDLRERQEAFSALARIPGTAADALIERFVDRVLSGSIEVAIELDVVEAARQRDAAVIREKLAAHEVAISERSVTERSRFALEGGDASAGAKVFFDKVDVSCVRCHVVDGRGGNVGPDLSTIATTRSREYLAASIVEPNRDIAEGFEGVTIVTDRGEVVTGVLRGEDESTVRIVRADAEEVAVPKARIIERGRADSAMPADVVRLLTARELRDLVEFLATRGIPPANR
jgi:quinoprotein glucose dehydrogenase